MSHRLIDTQTRSTAVPLIAVLGALLILLSHFSGCTGNKTDPQADSLPAKPTTKPLIITVSYPLEYLTERIAGGVFDVRCPVPDGQEASKWKPNRDEILKIQTAKMVVANGVGARFAKWLELASIPANKVCNSATRGLSLKDFIEIEDVQFTHSHGNLGEHSHPTNCAYTWLHPQMAQKQAKFIADELGRRFPEYANDFSKRYGKLVIDLKELQDAFDAIPSSAVSEFSAVLTTNPELKFISRACNWDDVHFKWFAPPENSVAVKEIEERLLALGNRSLIKRDGKTLLLSTYPFPESLVPALEPLAISVVVIDKLDVRPTTGDYISVMFENVNKLNESQNNDR